MDYYAISCRCGRSENTDISVDEFISWVKKNQRRRLLHLQISTNILFLLQHSRGDDATEL